MEDYIVVSCPHCKLLNIIYKKEINCAIFRHGVLKNNGNQIGPHTSKEECEKLVENKLIYGCGKPFIIKNKIKSDDKKTNEDDNEYWAEECDYI
jgi:hypothetical protein